MGCLRFLAGIGLVSIWSAVALAAADENGAEALLKNKGLRRLNNYFSLEEESELSRKLRAAESLRKKAFDAQQEAEQAQQVVDQKDRMILAYLQKRRELRAQLPFARTVEQNNQMVMALNELGDRIVIMQQSDQEEKARDEARAAANTALEQYVENLLDARQLLDSVQKKYEELASDPAVSQAIDEYNKTSPKTYRLGPSPLLGSNRRKLERLQETVLSEAIDLRRGEGGLWYVTAMFNGKVPKEIAIDTGASVVALPWEMAQAVGLTPGADAAVVTVQVADGRELEAKRVVADSIRVGKFTAKHVECVVMPEGLTDAPPLLGLSFFKTFNFKIDSGKGQLLMSQISTSATSGRSRSTPSRRPAGPPAEKATAQKGRPAGTDQPRQPADRTQQLARLLTPKDAQTDATGGVPIQIRTGERVMFKPSVEGPAETLRKRFGQPDAVLPFQFTRPSPEGEPKAFNWLLWIWGPVKVFVDETGTTRYFAVTEE